MKRNTWLFMYLCILLCMLMACTSETKKEKTEGNHEKQLQPLDKEDNQFIEKKSNEKEPMVKEDNGKEKDRERVNKKDPQYKIDEETWLIRPLDEQTDKKVVLLTIDDAPDQYALEMAEILKKHDAGAIFFVNGHFLETVKEKQTLKKIYDMGFMIGNHTYSHAYLPDLNEEEQTKEIKQVNERIEEITGERPKFFRAPHGANTDLSRKLSKEEQMVIMNWSYGYDFQPEYMEKAPLVDIMLQTELLGDGANLLMHDRKWTKNALEDIIIGLREQGYTIVDPRSIEVY